MPSLEISHCCVGRQTFFKTVNKISHFKHSKNVAAFAQNVSLPNEFLFYLAAISSWLL